jgi:mono/diheme cytochrome c family protein
MMMVRVLIAVAVLLLCSLSVASAADGAALYKAQCAKCHGDTGHADTTIGKAMKVPSLVGDANIQKMSDSDVAAKIKGNAKHPPTVKSLSDDDINALAAYVKGLAAGK